MAADSSPWGGLPWQLVKCDDDVYIHARTFSRLLSGLPDPPLYAGHILYSQAPVRDRTSKWFLDAGRYPLEAFPPYAEGPLYILSQPVAVALPYTVGHAAYLSSIDNLLCSA
jgi:hypothetical protein